MLKRIIISGNCVTKNLTIPILKTIKLNEKCFSAFYAANSLISSNIDYGQPCENNGVTVTFNLVNLTT